MKKARETFEPEEVKTFAEIAKNNPEQFIKAQENVIAQLQEQLLRSGKNTHNTQTQIEINLLKQKNEFLEAKNTQLIHELEKKETKSVEYRDFDSFKARILDMPLKKTLQPLFESFPEFEHLVSDKVCTEFPLLLYKLQGEIIDMAFGPPEKSYKGVTIVQRLQQSGTIPTNLFLLQINLKKTNMPDDQILNYYHNGMIDYMEFSLTPKTEALLNKFGEKFILAAGNMASHSSSSQIGCKIIASLPEAGGHTYRLKMYSMEKSKLLNLLQYVPGRIALTSDCWTSLTTDGYITLTARFVDKNWFLQKRTLAFTCMPPPHTGAALALIIPRPPIPPIKTA